MHLGACYVYYWELYVTRYIRQGRPGLATTFLNGKVKLQDSSVFVAVLNTDLAVAVVLLFHFQVTECHKMGQREWDKVKPSQNRLHSICVLCLTTQQASKKTSTNCWIVTAGGLTHSFIRPDLLKLLTCFLS